MSREQRTKLCYACGMSAVVRIGSYWFCYDHAVVVCEQTDRLWVEHSGSMTETGMARRMATLGELIEFKQRKV